MTAPDFNEMKQAVLNEVVTATNTYALMTRLIFSLHNQERLYQHYPFILDTLLATFNGHTLMTVCRLFDPKDDARHASLGNFLRRVVPHHAGDQAVPPRLQARGVEYTQRIAECLVGIEERWSRLVVHRNAYLAHRDMSKTKLPGMTYADIRECIEFAQQVVSGYMLAYEDATQLFEVTNLRDEPEQFLRWCRLDDYRRHFEEGRG